MAQVLIKAFYVFILYYALTQLNTWYQYRDVTHLDPLWPIAWVVIPGVSVVWAIPGILIFSFCGALAGALLSSQRWVRIWVFLSLLEFLGLKYSFGKIGHSMHLWLLISFLFVFLPKDWAKATLPRVERQMTLRIFWGAQTFILMTYTLAGLGKLLGAMYQIALGQIHIFHPQSLAYHIAERLIQTDSHSILGSFFVEHPGLGWPMTLIMLYLQVFSLWIAFRPNLHRAWGAFLILFHISVSLTLSIHFHSQVLLVALFFLISPFHYKTSWRAMCANLPIVGFVFKPLLR